MRPSAGRFLVGFLGLAAGAGAAGLTSLGILIGSAIVDSRMNRATVHASTSPDGTQRVVVTKRREWFGGVRDPRVELWIDLESVGAGQLLDQLVFSIERNSDVGTPSSKWSTGTVVVTGLERRHEVSATLRRSRPPATARRSTE